MAVNPSHDDIFDEEDDFVNLPPPIEKYDLQWRTRDPEYPSRCPHCKNWIGSNPASEDLGLQHILNGCKTFTNQGRYEWRHGAVLKYIDSLMDRKNYRVYADLPEKRTDSGGTVPEELLGPKIDLVGTAKPNMVFFSRGISEEPFTIGILELSIPWDPRVEAARAEKQAKNSSLVDLLSLQTQAMVRYMSIEIGSFNQRLSEGTKSAIKDLYNYTDGSIPLKEFRTKIVKLVDVASFNLFATRTETEWTPFTYYIELPPEIFGDKDNISSESEPTSVDHGSESGALEIPDHFQRVAEISQEEMATTIAEKKPEDVAFSLRTKLGIYGAAIGMTSYVIYYYWYIILTGAAIFLTYKVWTKAQDKGKKKE